MSQSRGFFVWHELLTPNKESATAFYPKVVSWKTQAWDKSPSYTLWTAPSGAIGGLGTPSSEDDPADAPAGWLPFVGVSDINESLDDARRLGARVITDISKTPAGGEWAVLADPQGAVFAIYASAGGEGDTLPAVSTPIGEFSWHELGTTDYKEALEFYSELFGWKLDAVHDMGAMGDYALFAAGGRQIGGMYNAQSMGGKAVRPGWMSYVHVDDADAAAEAAAAAGGTVIVGPIDVPGGGRIAMILDPDGMRFAVHAMPAKPTVARNKTPRSAKAAPAKKSATRASAKSAAKRPAVKSAAKKVAKKAAKKVARKVAKRAAKKPAKKTVKKAAPAKRGRPAQRSGAKRPAVAKRPAARAAKVGRPAGRRAKAGTRGRRARR